MSKIVISKNHLALIVLTLAGMWLKVTTLDNNPFLHAEAEASAGAILIASHQVQDFSTWKQIFDSAEDIKRKVGWLRGQIFTVNGNPNHVLVIEEFQTMAQARRFAGLKELRRAMLQAGMIGEPEFQFLTLASHSPADSHE